MPGTWSILPAVLKDQYRRLLTYWYRSKAVSHFFSTGCVVTSANGASWTPLIFSDRNYNDICYITGALIKITYYAKSMIKQARRHFEKASWPEIVAISIYPSLLLQHLFNLLGTQFPEEPFLPVKIGDLRSFQVHQSSFPLH